MPETLTAAADSGLERDQYAFGSVRYAWFVVAILAAVQIVSNMERQILSLMVEPLRRSFHIRDVDVSLLQGFAFALLYSLAALPIGWLADRWRRNWIILLGLTLWIVATVGCMIAQSYSALFAARLMTGLADASLLPASFSLLSDYFPRRRLAGAMSVVTGASFLGTGISLTFGGVLFAVLPVDRDILLPLAGSIRGWQASFGIICLFAIPLLFGLLAVREPPRRRGVDEKGLTERKPSLGQILRYLQTHYTYLGSLIAGITLLAAYQYGVMNWAVAMFMRSYGWSATSIGLLYGLFFMIIGSVASLAGGRICDHLRLHKRNDANFLIPLVAIIILLPTGLVFALSGNAIVSVTALGLITFLVILSFGPAMAAIPEYVPSAMRAQLIALTMLLSTLFGAGGGPWLVAAVTEYVFGDPEALHWSLAVCAPLLLGPAILCFAYGRRISAAVPKVRTGCLVVSTEPRI